MRLPPGSQLWRDGKLDEAIDECRNLTEGEEADPDAHKLLVFLLLQRTERDEAGGTYEGASSATFAEAIQAAEKALWLNRDDAESHLNLGVAYVKAASYLDIATAPELAPFHDVAILKGSRTEHLKNDRGSVAEVFLSKAAIHFGVASGRKENPWREGATPQVNASPDIRRRATIYLEQLAKVSEVRAAPKPVLVQYRFQSDSPEFEPTASGADAFAEDGTKLAEAAGPNGKPLYLPPDHCKKLAESGGITRRPTDGGAWEFREKHFDKDGKIIYEGTIRFDEFTGEKVGEEPIKGNKKTEYFRKWKVQRF